MTENPGGNAAAMLAGLAQDLFHAEAEVARLEDQLASAKEKVAVLSGSKLPELMDELGLSEYKTTSGLQITVKNIIRASLSKARLADGIKWLEENGLGRIVKREIRVSLGKGEDTLEQVVRDTLREKAPAAVVEAQPSVHAQTLSAAVREYLEAGRDVPMELLGVFNGRETKVEIPRGKKQ